ncbi:RhuM family protein [Nonomuraea sp. NPDC059007]|uniref:RhuM family protein n=1 Tax=Nonomuraea sp. NPDC059007 TaxID=3346692 RepID=UPI003678FDEC
MQVDVLHGSIEQLGYLGLRQPDSPVDRSELDLRTPVLGPIEDELIVKRADPALPNMGLTSWQGSRVRKGDVGTAKNYLTQDEVTDLNMLTTQFLDFAELRTRRRQQISLTDWLVATDRFIEVNEMRVLTSVGRVSHEEAERITHERYLTFDDQRRALERLRAEQEAVQDEQELLRWAAADSIEELEQIDDSHEEE